MKCIKSIGGYKEGDILNVEELNLLLYPFNPENIKNKYVKHIDFELSFFETDSATLQSFKSVNY